jgi:glutathione S-transferase
MNLVTVILVLALLQYIAFAMLVGGARGKYGVKAPAITGNETFERYFRVQQNTLELLVVFVPAIWLFGQSVSSLWAAILGGVYLVGRVVYFKSYVADPAKRSAVFGLSFLPIAAMLIGVLIKAGMQLLA